MTTPLIPGQAPLPPHIAGTPPDGEIGIAYSFTPTVTFGTRPFAFTSTGGALPDGLSLNATTGALTGTPTVAATFSGLDITIIDAVRLSATLGPFDIAIGGVLSIEGTPVTTATQGTPYAGFTVTGVDGVEPYVYSLHTGSLPDGITLDADTGEVAGTPTEDGEFDGIVIRVTDDVGATADLPAFDLTVEASSFPVWLPQAPSGDYANFFIGAKDAHYYANGETTAAAMLADPGLVTAGVGLVANGVDTAALIGAICTALATSNWTALLTGVIGSGSMPAFSYVLACEQATSVQEIACWLGGVSGGLPTKFFADAYDADGGPSITNVGPDLAATDAWKFAFTTTPEKQAGSCNGSFAGAAMASFNADALTHFSLLGYILDSGANPSDNFTVESFALWTTPQPDVDLTTLSTP